MESMRLNSGLPIQQSYYNNLVDSAKIRGQSRNREDFRSSTRSEIQHDVMDGNPFVTSSDSPGLDSLSESTEKVKSRNYTVRSKSLQDLKNTRRASGFGHHGSDLNSDYFLNLYNKYPHTFHRSKPTDPKRPSRRMFNSGLRVHFDDEVHYDDDVRSVSSERPTVTKWDREMESIFGHHRHPRSCLTSPTPSLILDSTERYSEYKRLPGNKSHTLPNSHTHNDRNSEEYVPVQFHRANSSGSDYGADRIKLLELELERKESQLRSFKRRLEFHQQIPGSSNGTLSDSQHWRVLSPDSPPDSAIDVDSSSVQSSNVGPSYLSPRNEPGPSYPSPRNEPPSYNADPGHLNAHGSTDHLVSIDGYLKQKHNENTVSNYIKDSDLDSGFAQSLSRLRLDNRIYDSRTSALDLDFLHPRPMSAVEFGHLRHPPEQFGFQGTWRTPETRNSRRKDSDDDSIIQEIQHHPFVAGYQFRAVHQQQEEEVDDSDPSLGMPTIAEEDKFVREMYQQRKKPTPYKIVQRCLTARPNSAPTWEKCTSGSSVSAICTPRREEKSLRFAPVDPKGTITDSVQTFKSKSESSLLRKPEVRSTECDENQFRFNPKLEQKIRRHSRKLSWSSDSDQSEKTLVSSQIALDTDGRNHFMDAHCEEFGISEKNRNNSTPLEIVGVNDKDSPKSCFNNPVIKVEFKKDLKVTDLNDYSVRHSEGSDTDNSGLSGPERLTPYEVSVMKMDRQGLDVEDLIESDSDNVFAKPLVLKKKVPKSDQRELEERNTSKETGSRSHVPVSRESSTSLPESVNTEPVSGSSELSVESDSNQGTGNTAAPAMADMSDPQDSDYATVMCPDEDGSHQLTVSDYGRDTNKDKPDTSHHIYAKVKRVNRKPDVPEPDKVTLGSEGEGGSRHGDGTNGCTGGVVDSGSKRSQEMLHNTGARLSREVSQSTPNVAGTSICNADQEVPPLPVRNYGSTTNLSKSKELSGSRISLSNKMSNLRAAAKSKFKTLRKAVSLDKGINKTQGEFRPGDIPTDTPPQGKPPKAKKGKSLKKWFGKKSSKHRSTENFTHGGTETTDKVMVTGHCSSIESRTSEDEVSVSQLREVLPDGTQIVELNRRHKGPIGFYIARGSTQFKHGIFVSRFSQEVDADDRFAGLINIGDEILDVNGHNVSDASLDDVYDLMCDQTLEVRILPLLSRKDIHEQSS